MGTIKEPPTLDELKRRFRSLLLMALEQNLFTSEQLKKSGVDVVDEIVYTHKNITVFKAIRSTKNEVIKLLNDDAEAAKQVFDELIHQICDDSEQAEAKARQQAEEEARQQEAEAKRKTEEDELRKLAEVDARRRAEEERSEKRAAEEQRHKRAERNRSYQAPPGREKFDMRQESGRLEEKRAYLERRREVIEFAVSRPSFVKRDVPFLLEVLAFLPDERELAISRATETFGKDASFRSGGSAAIRRGDKLRIEIHAGPWPVEPNFQTIVWAGRLASVSFRITPDARASGPVHAKCRVFLRGLTVAEIQFDLMLAETQSNPTVTSGKQLTGFISYASQDRIRVLARVQGIEKFARVYMDVRDLKSGAPYPIKLLEQIDASDVLYLFWSRHAKDSAWVDKEWRYGLHKHGIKFIDPVPLVDPRNVPPPPELSGETHFNDWTLAFIEHEKSRSGWSRFLGWLSGD